MNKVNMFESLNHYRQADFAMKHIHAHVNSVCDMIRDD